MTNMRKKIIITGVVLIIIVGGVAAYVDSLNLKKMGQAAQNAWPGKSHYMARLEKIDKLKADLVGHMATYPKGQKMLAKIGEYENSLKASTDREDQIKTINRIEKNAADLIVIVDNDPTLQALPDVKTDIQAISTQESSIWSKSYDDQTAFYNIAIGRIRHTATTLLFGLQRITPIANTWEFLRADRLNHKIK